MKKLLVQAGCLIPLIFGMSQLDKNTLINKQKIIKETVEPTLEFKLKMSAGSNILEFSDQQDVFDIRLQKKGNEEHQDPVGFCSAFPNMAIFSETEGTYTNVYPQYYDDEGDLKDEDNIPPTLLSYNRANKHGLVAIDSEFNLYIAKIETPTNDRPYHQPLVTNHKSFKSFKPNAQENQIPLIATLNGKGDNENNMETSFIFFNDQVIAYDHVDQKFANKTTDWIPVPKIKRLSIGYANGIGNDDVKSRPLVFVAAGDGGAYIYEVTSDKSLKLLKSISSLTINKNADFKTDFTDVDHREDEDAVYFLEKNTGVHKFNIQTYDNESPSISHDDNFHFVLERGLRVRHYSNYNSHNVLMRQTFIAIQEVNDLKYTVEYLINYQNQEYFVNKVQHFSDIDIEDIAVAANFAVLLGTNIHKVIYHSIYENFETDQMDYVDDFSLSFIPGLVDSEVIVDYGHLNLKNYNPFADKENPKLFLIGISKRNIVYYNIARYYPAISCWPVYWKPQDGQKPLLKEGAYYYDVIIKSRNCKTKDTQDKYADYVMCEQKYSIVVNLTESWLDDGALVWIVVIIVFTLAVLSILGIWGFCKYRRTRDSGRNINDKIRDYIQKVKQSKKSKKTKEQKYMPMEGGDESKNDEE